MSKRSERREAERHARKEAYRRRREQHSQFAQTSSAEAQPIEGQAVDTAGAAPAVELIQATAPVARSASPFNSTMHGCCANEILILAHEKRSDFEALEHAWFQAFAPVDEAGTNLIHQLVAADWLHQRSNRTYAQVEAQIFAEESNPLNWTEAHHKALARFCRYRTANQNAFKRALKLVEDYFKNRAAQTEKAERLEMAKARLKVYELKNTPPDWNDLIVKQHQLAKRLKEENL